MSYDLSHDPCSKGPRVCNTTKQGAPPSKWNHEDQGALQTGQGQSFGEVQINRWTSHGAPLNPLLKNGKNMPPQQTCQERAAHQNSWRALIREATKRPKITQKEQQSSKEEIGVSVHRTTLSRTLHRAGLYRRVARKKPMLKGIWETPQTNWRR